MSEVPLYQQTLGELKTELPRKSLPKRPPPQKQLHEGGWLHENYQGGRQHEQGEVE